VIRAAPPERLERTRIGLGTKRNQRDGRDGRDPGDPAWNGGRADPGRCARRRTDRPPGRIDPPHGADWIEWRDGRARWRSGSTPDTPRRSPPAPAGRSRWARERGGGSSCPGGWSGPGDRFVTATPTPGDVRGRRRIRDAMPDRSPGGADRARAVRWPAGPPSSVPWWSGPAEDVRAHASAHSSDLAAEPAWRSRTNAHADVMARFERPWGGSLRASPDTESRTSSPTRGASDAASSVGTSGVPTSRRRCRHRRVPALRPRQPARPPLTASTPPAAPSDPLRPLPHCHPRRRRTVFRDRTGPRRPAG